MILKRDDVTKLGLVLHVANIAGFESLILEEGRVRALNESKTCALVASEGGPVLSQKMGLSRLSALRSRLGLFSGDLQIEARESNRSEISMLEISSGRSKAQFRCTSTALINAPQTINDEPGTILTASKQEIKLILDAVRAMGSKLICIKVSEDGHVRFEVSDSTNDIFTAELDAEAEFINTSDSITCNYSTDVICPVLRASCEDSDSVDLVIGQKGTLSLNLLGFPLTLLPQISDTED
jgi:hypothetical protein